MGSKHFQRPENTHHTISHHQYFHISHQLHSGEKSWLNDFKGTPIDNELQKDYIQDHAATENELASQNVDRATVTFFKLVFQTSVKHSRHVRILSFWADHEELVCA